MVSYTIRRSYRSSKTPDRYVFSVIYTQYGARGDTQGSAWSRALTTAWSRAYCAITIMASNTYSVPHEESELMSGMYDVTSIATIHWT